MQLRQKFDELSSLQVQILAVAPDKVELLTTLVKALKLPFPLLADPLHTVFKDYSLITRGQVLGADFVLDKEGIVRYEYRGATPDDGPPFAELIAAVKNIALKGDAGDV